MPVLLASVLALAPFAALPSTLLWMAKTASRAESG